MSREYMSIGNKDQLSPTVLGAMYALHRGDLQTASQLGELALDHNGYSVEAYVLLSHAYSGLGQWVKATSHGRLALCLGAKEQRMAALLAGVYSAIGMTIEAQWVEESCKVVALNLEDTLTSQDAEALTQVLSIMPRLPHKLTSNKRRHTQSEILDVPSSSLKGHFSWGTSSSSSLPDWLESSEMIDRGDLSLIKDAKPDWLVDISDSLESVFQQSSNLPNWLEASESLDPTQSLQSEDLHTLPIHHPIATNEAIIPPVTSSKDSLIDLIPSAHRAQQLGLGDEHEIAIELEELTLTMPSAKPRKMFGPLLLALTVSHLILVAYEGDQQRQKPWAFTPQQLVKVDRTNRHLTLHVEGHRQIVFQLPDSLLAQSVAERIQTWQISL